MKRLPAIVITDLHNVFYLTGFRGSAGIAAFDATDAALWVDPRYTLQARGEATSVEVIEQKGPLLKGVAHWLKKTKGRKVGYEDAHLTCHEFTALEHLSGKAIRFLPASGIIESLRTTKDQEELACIRAACQVTSKAFEETLPQIKPGVSEADLAAELEYRMRRNGADGPAFETIVASGPRGAFPHARPTRRILGKSELVIFDLGAILHGYAADMTRTIFMGSNPGRQVRRLYNAVLEAQRRAVESIREGVRCSDVDAAARRALGRRGLAKYFTHSTGHGVGLEIHERPRLGKSDKTRLQVGCVVTAEPGVYIEGLGGIRLEDTVCVGPDGPEILTTAPMDAWIIS